MILETKYSQKAPNMAFLERTVDPVHPNKPSDIKQTSSRGRVVKFLVVENLDIMKLVFNMMTQNILYKD